MLEPIYTKQFRKELKLAQKRRMKIDKLGVVMEMIINELPLPPERKNHSLQGEWKGYDECHIQGAALTAS